MDSEVKSISLTTLCLTNRADVELGPKSTAKEALVKGGFNPEKCKLASIGQTFGQDDAVFTAALAGAIFIVQIKDAAEAEETRALAAQSGSGGGA